MGGGQVVNKRRKLNRLDAFDYINYTFMILLMIVTLYPFIYVVAGSFSDGMDYIRGGVYLFPRIFSTANYQMVLEDDRLWIGFRVTILRTVIGTFTSVFFTAMVGYAMSRRELKHRNLYYWINIFTMFFGGGLVPYFLLLKSMGLINSFLVYIIPGLYSVFNMIVFQNFFKEIPEEIHESALIDGASEFKIFIKLFIPLSAPVIVTVGLWVAVGHWNSFFDSMLFTSDKNLQTLQFYLMKVIREASLTQGGAAEHLPPQVVKTVSVATIRHAAIVISTVPILLVYPFIQRHLSKGIMLGSLKG